MSKTGILLIGSLALNAFFAVLFALPSNRQSSAIPLSASRSQSVEPRMPEPGSQTDASQARREEQALSPSRAKPGHPQARDSLDGLVAELRGRGFDEGAIRSLAVAEVERRFADAVRELLKANARQDYWEASLDRGALSGKTLEEFQRLRRERRAAIARLFGEEYADSLETPTANTYANAIAMFRQFDYLPPDKRMQLIEYLETAAGKQPRSRRVAARSGMNPFAEEVKKEEEIRLLLGPVLFEEYVKRSSGTSHNLREELAAFRPTRAEFDSILTIERDFLARASEVDAFSGTRSNPKMQAAHEQKRETIRGALGEMRFADYERATDYSYRHLDTLARELGLDASVARSSYARIEQARARTEALMRNRDPRDPALQNELQALRRDLQARLVEDFDLTQLSDEEAQSWLGPALNTWPRGWTGMRRGILTR